MGCSHLILALLGNQVQSGDKSKKQQSDRINVYCSTRNDQTDQIKTCEWSCIPAAVAASDAVAVAPAAAPVAAAAVADE